MIYIRHRHIFEYSWVGKDDYTTLIVNQKEKSTLLESTAMKIVGDAWYYKRSNRFILEDHGMIPAKMIRSIKHHNQVAEVMGMKWRAQYILVGHRAQPRADGKRHYTRIRDEKRRQFFMVSQADRVVLLGEGHNIDHALIYAQQMNIPTHHYTESELRHAEYMSSKTHKLDYKSRPII